MTDEQLALLCRRAQHIVRHQANLPVVNEGAAITVVLEHLIADHAEPKDIYGLFREVREHPDFVFGTIFTRADFEGDPGDEDAQPRSVEGFLAHYGHRAEDRLAEIGNWRWVVMSGAPDPNIITLYAEETQEEQAARLRALYTNPDTFYFALDDHDRDDLPFNPVPADAWVWSTGDRWQAVVAGFHADDWWEGADPEDIAARPDPWFRPISDVPTTGTLEYALRDGTIITA